MAGALAADRLGPGTLISFALTAAAPIMVVGGLVTTGWAVTGVVALPLVLLGMAVLLRIFSSGYVAIARHVRHAGSLYSYVSQGLGPHAGVIAAMVQLVTYTCMQVGLYGIAGVQAEATAADLIGVHAPWWAWALAAWGLVAVLGTRGIGVSSKILAVAVCAELGLMAVVSIVDLLHPAGGHVSFAALDPGSLTTSSAGEAIAIATAAFCGFEAPPVYSEESRHPGLTIRRSVLGSLRVMTVVYVVVAWAMTVATAGDVIGTAQRLGPDMLLVPAAGHLGDHSLVPLGHLLLLTSIGAGLLSYHNTVARAGFALGRDRVLPAVLAGTNPRTGAPMVASLAQSLCGLTAIGLTLVMGWDPLTHLFFAAGVTGALGVLLLLTTVSVAIVAYFRTDRRGERARSVLVAPVVATVGLGGCVVLVVAHFDALIGVAPSSPARWWLPASYLVAIAVGVVGAGWMGWRRPQHLLRVGAGTPLLTGVGR